MLKVLRGYAGRPRICELVRTQFSDLTVKGTWAGRGCNSSTTLAPLANLPVLEIVAASHILADLTLAPATVVHDCLKDTQ
jgi:acetoacetate decarboxylase